MINRNWTFDIKFLYILLIQCFILVSPAVSENYIDESFSDYGIKKIGIYTQGYKDIRSDNFVFEIAAIKANGIIQDPRFFRYRYCNYDLVTPPLTNIRYPLGKSTAEDIDNILDIEINKSLSSLGWETELIKNIDGISLKEMLLNSKSEGLDAVLIVRYTPITYILPIKNYVENPMRNKYSAETGRVQKGMGLIPAIELYDTATGTRLWYSAYLTGHQNITKKKSFEYYVETVEALFANGATRTDIEAASKMINLTILNKDNPFPTATESEERRASSTFISPLKHFLWTDYPAYAFYGNQLGIGYSLSYISNLDILYKDTFNGAYPDSTPIEKAGMIDYAFLHKIIVPFFSIATHNFAIEPTAYFGLMPSTGTKIQYTDIKDDHHGGYSEELINDVAYTTITILGIDLSIKYFLRFTDNFSAFIGCKGNIDLLKQQVESYYFPNNSDGFVNSYNSLYKNYNTGIALNASAILGITWASKHPVELFGELTPVGSGNGMMITAGIKIVPAIYGYIPPHATNISEGTKGF